MSDSESLDYLQPGFDARTLTIPRLRSILVAHNVPYSSSAKKAQLVEIFNEQIVPQSKKILAQRAKAKRTSQGIFDAEGTAYGNPFDDHENPPPPPASTRRSRSPRKASLRVKSEEPEQPILPRQRSPTKRTPRAASRQLQASDTDTGPEMVNRPVSRRSRKTNDAVPQIKTEESDGLFRRTSDVFTSDNPFQSGSSPPLAERPTSSRRKTGGYGDARPVSRLTSSYSTRRRTDGPTYSGDEDMGFAQRFDVPVSQVVRRAKTPDVPPEPVVEAGEEFTVEEQQELAAVEQTVVVRPKSRPASNTSWGTAISVILITAASLYGGWWRQEKIAVGYCDVGKYTSSIPSEIPVPEWAQSVLGTEMIVPRAISETLEPKCEKCPKHAVCHGDFSVTCAPDYILTPHPFSIGGVIPLPPTCEPDGEKARRVQQVVNKAVEELRERTAKFECGELFDEQGVRAESPRIEEQDLKQVISQKRSAKRSKKLDNQEFEDLWGAAIGEIKKAEEIKVEEEVPVVTIEYEIPEPFRTPTSRPPLSLAFHSPVRSNDPLETDWTDLNSRLAF